MARGINEMRVAVSSADSLGKATLGRGSCKGKGRRNLRKASARGAVETAGGQGGRVECAREE